MSIELSVAVEFTLIWEKYISKETRMILYHLHPIRNDCYCLGVLGGGGGGGKNPHPEVYKKNVSGHRVKSKKKKIVYIQVTLKIDLKVMMVKVMYTLIGVLI